MNAIAIAVASGLLGFVVGWAWHSVLARREAAAQQLAIIRHENAAIGLRNDNRHLAEWCARFRDLYLDAVTIVEPRAGAELRRKWAAVQAPEVVARALEHCRHA